jgi:hypothetical protein
MATTTTNFGWDIPQSTDLVKDGATAIAALGQDIDTALVDLKGGTTGQILAKASNTDLDYSWITNDVGDITAVTAGTGISGGGTSGAVTITNSMATAIDAKGDLIGGTGADTFSRLAVGTNGQVLTADSTASTGLAYTNKGWTLISTTALSGASVTLSSIPQTYQSLKLIVLAMQNSTASGNFKIEPNAASTVFVTGQEAVTNYQIVSGAFATQQTSLLNNPDNSYVLTLDRYYETSANEKPFFINYFYVNPSGTNLPGMAGGMFYSPGAGISSIRLSNSGGNFSTGTAYLYGVA